MSNFYFLKNIDSKLYSIIADAEKLYRDEYFEQCIIQTRKFAENVCKDVLANRIPPTSSFDEMLATLKDKSNKSEQEKEFIEDLYFIKREGNISAHNKDVKQSGITALECLKRAFEVSINYAVYHKKASHNILNKHYNIDLLINGKNHKKSISEKYQKVKTKTIKTNKQQYIVPVKTNVSGLNKHYLVSICLSISLLFALIIFFLTI